MRSDRREACRPGHELAVGIGFVRALDDGEHAGGVGHREGEDGDAVEAAAGRHDAAGADASGGRLQADDLVEAGGHAARSRRCRCRARRARRRAATTTAEPELEPPLMRVGVAGAARPAVGRARADEAGGELVEVGLADADGAGGDQLLRPRRRAPPAVGERRTGGGGRQPGDVDVVLDRERHTEQGQLGAPLCTIEAGGARQQCLDLRLDQSASGDGDPHAGRAFDLEAALQREQRLPGRGAGLVGAGPVGEGERCGVQGGRRLVYREVHRTIRARARSSDSGTRSSGRSSVCCNAA